MVFVTERGWVFFFRDFLNHRPGLSAPSAEDNRGVRPSFQFDLNAGFGLEIDYMAFDGTRILLATVRTDTLPSLFLTHIHRSRLGCGRSPSETT